MMEDLGYIFWYHRWALIPLPEDITSVDEVKIHVEYRVYNSDDSVLHETDVTLYPFR